MNNEMICDSTTHWSLNDHFKVDFDDYPNQVVINMNRNTRFSNRILVLNRWNKSSVFFYYPTMDSNETTCVVQKPLCRAPPFVKHMDPKLFSKILGVVPYTDRSSVFLILFNITNRLKYCFTEETEVWHNFEFNSINTLYI